MYQKYTRSLKMKTLFLMLGALAATCGAEPWTNLAVNFYRHYQLPTKVSDIKGGEYVLMAHDKELNVDLYSYPGDPRVAVMFDTHGNVAGLRTGYIKDDVPTLLKDYPDYFNKPPFVAATYWNISLWHSTLLFLEPGKLKAGGRADTKGLVAEDVYFKLNGKWTKIPTDECEAEKLGFVPQLCYPGMGMHYTWSISLTSACEDYQGFTILYDKGHLTAVNINPFGGFTKKNRDWFEKVVAVKYKALLPNTPDNFVSFLEKVDGTALHIYLNANPQGIVCTAPNYDPNRCKKPGK